jgi:hypothetical protein
MKEKGDLKKKKHSKRKNKDREKKKKGKATLILFFCPPLFPPSPNLFFPFFL